MRRPSRILRRAAVGAALALAVYAVAAAWSLVVPPRYDARVGAPPESFDAFLARKQAVSVATGARPGNEERLVRHAPGRTRYAILYLHGFGASRAEGELVADSVAARLGANLYYPRLPGHGTNMDDHAAHGFREYLDCAEEALAMMPKLGERVILIGTSMGGTIATALAARHPERVYALILASPLYAYRDPSALLLSLPGGMSLIRATHGPVRDTRGADPEGRYDPDRGRVWLLDQRYEALLHLEHLRRYAARPEVFRRVTSPALLLYYFRDEAHQDPTASVPAMRRAFAAFGGAARNPLNTEVPVADGAHVLLSRYVRTDKTRILAEIFTFLGHVETGGASVRSARLDRIAQPQHYPAESGRWPRSRRGGALSLSPRARDTVKTAPSRSAAAAAAQETIS